MVGTYAQHYCTYNVSYVAQGIAVEYAQNVWSSPTALFDYLVQTACDIASSGRFSALRGES